LRRHDLVLTALALVSLVAACGVADDGGFTPIGADEIGQSGLLDTTIATTTTTTIATTTTAAPATTTPATVPTTLVETTTTLPVEAVSLYYIAGNQLTAVPFNLPRPANPFQAMQALLQGPPPDQIGVGLRSALPEGAVIDVTVERGVAVVDLSNTAVQAIAPDQLPLAFGQMVLTLELRGIGAVRFRSDGVDQSVTRGDGSITEPGVAVTFDDYTDLVAR
jgi:hypothetical protein